MKHRGTLAVSILLGTGVLTASATPALASGSHHATKKGTEISSVTTKKYGRVVSNSKGRVMYLFTGDGHKVSHCSGACAASWPKVMSKHAPRAGKDIGPKHLSRTKKGQVTYYGHPLYYFVSGKKPGSTSGEDLGGFFVVSTHGKAVKKPVHHKTGGGGGPSGPAEVTTGMAGGVEVITNSAGLTLYALSNPTEQSTYWCSAACLSFWVPLLTKGAPTAAGDAMSSLLGSVSRPGVGDQVTYNQYPLYTYVGDTSAGQATGEGLTGPYNPPDAQYWYDVTPAGAFNP
ncbi:MAG TPA: hypothetical protein VME70_01880 [Mycobacteriales bacterium]|nr:hypothetical protein [Mycobacteriales bacterium]